MTCLPGNKRLQPNPSNSVLLSTCFLLGVAKPRTSHLVGEGPRVVNTAEMTLGDAEHEFPAPWLLFIELAMQLRFGVTQPAASSFARLLVSSASLGRYVYKHPLDHSLLLVRAGRLDQGEIATLPGEVNPAEVAGIPGGPARFGNVDRRFVEVALGLEVGGLVRVLEVDYGRMVVSLVGNPGLEVLDHELVWEDAEAGPEGRLDGVGGAVGWERCGEHSGEGEK